MFFFCVDEHICALRSGSMHVYAPTEHLCRRAYTSILCVYFHSSGFLLAWTDVRKPTKSELKPHYNHRDFNQGLAL